MTDTLIFSMPSYLPNVCAGFTGQIEGKQHFKIEFEKVRMINSWCGWSRVWLRRRKNIDDN